MQEIIKRVGPSRQLFETVNFAFMKIFDFLVKIAIFEAFFNFLEIRVMHYGSIRTLDLVSNVWHESSKNWRNAPEIAILTKKSKIFIKAKLTVSKSYLLGLVYFMISSILRGALI